MVPRRHDAGLWRRPGARRRPRLVLLTAFLVPVSPAIGQSAPQVTGIDITSDPGSSGFYTGDDVIEVTVTFDQNVLFGTTHGVPSIDIEVGGVSRRAHLSRANGSSIVFDYRVHVGGYAPEVAAVINHHRLETAHDGEEDLDGVSIAAGTISLNGGTITNSSDLAAQLTHPGLAAQPDQKVDSVRPVFLGRPVVDGDTVTVFYRETLDSTGSPPAGNFTVRVSTSEDRDRSVTNVALVGNEVRLTLDQAVEHDDALFVGFSHTNEIRDLAGNSGFDGSGMAVNMTPEPESTSAEGPSVTALAVGSTPTNGSTYGGGESVDIAVRFDGAVTVDTSAGIPSLAVMVGARLRRARYVIGSGTTELTFRHEVGEGFPLLVATFLSYHWGFPFAPGDEDGDGLSVPAGRIRLNGGTVTGNGGDADLDHPELPADGRHQVDGARPLLTGTPEADGSVVTLRFSETLDQSSRPEAGDFRVQARRADRDRRVLTVSVTGSTVELGIYPPLAPKERLWVTYTPGDTALQDRRGNGVPGVVLTPIVNSKEKMPESTADPNAARVVSVGIDSTSGEDGIYAGGDRIDVDVTFDGDVTVDTTNGEPLLELEVGGFVEHATYRAGSGTSTLTFSYDVAEGWPPGMGDQIRSEGVIARIGDLDTDGVRVPPGRIRLNGATIADGSSRDADLRHSGLAPQAGHRVDGVRPYVLAEDSTVRTSTIAVWFSEALKTENLALTGFTVEGARDRTITAVSVAGRAATLAVTPPFSPGESATVTYTPGTDPIRDLVGNPAFAGSFTATARSGGGGGGGGGSAPPADEDDDDDDGSGGGGGGTGTGGGGGGDGAAPPRAAITTSADCAGGLCRARTGTPVTFEDTSTGSVRYRTWDLGDGTGPGRNRTVRHAWSEPGFYEVSLWTSNGTDESTASLTFLVESSDPAGTCVADTWTLCLQESRYAVEVDWWTAGSEGGKASVVHAGTSDSGLFWFLNPDNWEVLIKVLDACTLNENVWVFSASTTDLGYSIRVTDTVTGVVRDYRNEPGMPAPATTDGKAFPGGCLPTTTVDAATPPP